MVASGAARLVELVQGPAELVEGPVVGEVAGHEPEPLVELLPDLLPKLGSSVFAHGVVHDLGEVLVGPVAPGETDQREAGWQQAAVGEVIDRGHQLLAREVARDSEQHQRGGAGDAGKAAILRRAEGIARSAHALRCLR